MALYIKGTYLHGFIFTLAAGSCEKCENKSSLEISTFKVLLSHGMLHIM